jgi:ribose transport system permease protein
MPGINVSTSRWINSMPAGIKTYLPSFVAIVFLFTLGEFVRKGFASAGNINSILAQSSILMFIAAGQLFVIISGEFNIDLSVGACMSMGAMLLPALSGGNPKLLFVCILILIVLAAAIGCLSGLGVQLLRIPALAMTLVMATVIDGFTLAFTQGHASTTVPGILKRIGAPTFGNIRAIFIIVIAAIIILELLLRKTNLCQSIYLIGSNRKAAKLSGLSVNILAILAFVFSSIISTLSGVLLVGYVGNGQMKMGDNYTMMSIAACVIGGAKLSGGAGTLVGASLGSIVLTVLTSLLVVFGLKSGTRIFFQGMILLLILTFNARSSTVKLRQ